MSVNILLVDDHQIVRQGLKLLIDNQDGWCVCAEASDGLEAIEAVKNHKPDVVVMDIGMPKLNGVEATVQVCGFQPGVKVIALSVHTDATLVARMLRAGATGYVPKASAYDELVAAIETVLSGKMYVSPEVTGFVVAEFILEEKNRYQHGVDRLTPTERMVLQQIASGFQSKEIATNLDISPRTVDSHRRAIMQKLNASGIADLTRLAIRHGLIDID